MRLWHESLIPLLPNKQLLGQHRECCALRGKGWGKKHSVVDYVFLHEPTKLYQYHNLVIDELKTRGYKIDPVWKTKHTNTNLQFTIYAEHNNLYLLENFLNLERKGIFDSTKYENPKSIHYGEPLWILGDMTIKLFTDTIMKIKNQYKDLVAMYRACETQEQIRNIQKQFYSWSKR